METRIPLKLLQCHARAHCRVCREDSDTARRWRESVVGVAEFDCPFGVGTDAEAAPVDSGIGDRYKKAMARRLGGVPCGACEAERKRLNTLTAEQVRAERDQVIEATVQRAKALPRWRDRIRAKLGDAVAPAALRRIVGECLDQAIQAEPQTKPYQPVSGG